VLPSLHIRNRIVRSAKPASQARFVSGVPSSQTAVDAVPETWASKLPPPLQEVRAGDASLFADPRIQWAFECLGGVKGGSVLDLGPLEGGSSFMAQRAGASRVVGVEANTMAYFKCLVAKELLRLDRCSFLCGEALAYLGAAEESFDLCIASGLLYHMVEPMQLLELISARARRLYIWTHVWAEEVRDNAPVAARLGPAEERAHGNFHYHVHRYSYERDKRFRAFWGGTAPYSNWLPREDLMRALEHFGWRNMQLAFDETHHVNGPSLALVAERVPETDPGVTPRKA
jgi:hypothetical protein